MAAPGPFEPRRRIDSRLACGLIAGAVASLTLACSRSSAPDRAGAPRSHDYRLEGTVVRVARDTGLVSIRHKAIPGFMPAMTMPFDLKGRPILGDLEPGDKVSGTLRVSGDNSELVQLEITEAATPGAAEQGTSAASSARRQLASGQSVPDFAVTTQDGQALRLSELRGKVVVLTFIYTRCPLPNFCPLMDQKFSQLATMIKGNAERADKVRLLSVSFDPEHDTPEVLAAHARLRGAKPPLWRFAVASHDELRKVAEPLGLLYGPAPNEIIHNLSTAVIGSDGKLVRLERGNTWSPEDLLKTVVGEVKK
jgi:protein SCO1/2